MLQTIMICGTAFLITAIAFAIHPGLGLVVGALACYGVDGLLSKD